MKRKLMERGALACVLFLAAFAGNRARPASEAATQVLADVAGTWHMRTMNLTGDKVLLTYDIIAKDKPSGWILDIPGQAPIAMRILEATNESLVTEAGPYPSALRENMNVTTRLVLQFHGDRVEGILIGLYDTPKGRTTVPLRVDGKRSAQAPPTRG